MLNHQKKEFKLLNERVKAFVSSVTDSKLRDMFVNCFYNTLDTTTEKWKDGTTYIFTGDIDAMWLRDSSCQVMQYLEFIDGDAALCSLIKGLIKRQLIYIKTDPYANAFNKCEKTIWQGDECEKRPFVWERKFELDSLCYPLWLTYKYCTGTGDYSPLDEGFMEALDVILAVFITEQRHKLLSPYYHYRPTEEPSFSVPNRGRGGEVAVCGLIWSGYRPSDDPCELGYFIPGNMFVSAVLKDLISIKDKAAFGNRVAVMEKLAADIDDAIKKYAIVPSAFGNVYAYEVDGLGGVRLMDDANVPSLLSLPYIGYGDTDEVYLNTRAFALSKSNPYYYEGKCISGIGSPHTPKDYVWPISLAMQGLTASDAEEVNAVLDMLMNGDAGTGLMHESVHKDDANTYTRSWFAWANSLFSLFVLKRADDIKYIRG